MKGHLEDEKMSWLAFFACFITYMVICITKSTYSTAIAAIVQEGLFTKSRAGLINSSFYLVYGASQFLGGYLSDRVSPVKLIMFALLGSVLANVVMAMSSSFMVMLVVWSFNGFVQFAMWPSILKLISTVVMPEHKQKAMTYISFAYCSGMMISYALSMPILHFWNWPALFVTSVIILLITIPFFAVAMRRVHNKLLPGDAIQQEVTASKEAQPTTSVPMWRLLLSSGLILIFLPALIRCMLDLGLKSWVPTMIMESYGVTPGFAGLLTTILLFVNLSGVFLINLIYPRRIHNLCATIALFFVAALPLLFLLLLIGRIPLVLVVLLLAAITTFMYSGNQMLNVMMPMFFAPYGKTGMVAGILNAFGCFGNMIASYLFGLLAEHFGWSVTIGSWIVLTVIAILALVSATPLWGRFTTRGVK